MMYTVGHGRSYDEAISNGGTCVKLGPDSEGYPGGWVFVTLKEARFMAAKFEGFKVYELHGSFSASRRFDGQLHLNQDAFFRPLA